MHIERQTASPKAHGYCCVAWSSAWPQTFLSGVLVYARPCSKLLFGLLRNKLPSHLQVPLRIKGFGIGISSEKADK